MLKETIVYVDYNDMERTEDYYFNLTEAEIMEMEMSMNGGLAEMIKRIVKSQDFPSIVKIFKEIILKAYGEKSLDGRRFIKSEELSREFSQTEAYSKLFMKLSTDADAAARFMNGIVPRNVAKKMTGSETREPRTMPSLEELTPETKD
ncbi:hypothetical protein AALC25_00090 [Lachnospiraceae bacterium 29-84]